MSKMKTKKPKKNTELKSIAEAAFIANKSMGTIYHALREGKLKATIRGPRVYVTIDALSAWRNLVDGRYNKARGGYKIEK